MLKAAKSQKVWGMRVRGGIAEKGRYINKNSKIIGHICSSTWSPYQECGVCIVKMDDAKYSAGTEVEVKGIDGKIHSAQLCTLPMIDEEKLIVRGKSSLIPKVPNPWKG